MAFKLNNPPYSYDSTPIYNVSMEEGVLGKANNNGTIIINKDIKDPKQIEDVISHESIHIDQMKRGDLDYDDSAVYWKGKTYSRSKMQEGLKTFLGKKKLMPNPKKKFKDTKVGKFLLGKSGIINVISNILPDQGALGMVKNLIEKDPDLPPQDKETALMLLEQDTIELQEISKRWDSDMKSDSWLSKNTRPMTLIFLTVSVVIFILLDGFDIHSV